jgi:exonuclease III
MRIITYNCCGLNLQQRPTLQKILTANNDIICLQETWLTKQDLGLLNTLHKNYHGTGKSTTDSSDGPILGHPPGGVAILWREKLDAHVEVLDLQHDWLCGISIRCQSKVFVIVCVYMPHYVNSGEQEDRYLSCLGALQSVLEELNTSTVFAIGDWNADITHIWYPFEKLLYGSRS